MALWDARLSLWSRHPLRLEGQTGEKDGGHRQGHYYQVSPPNYTNNWARARAATGLFIFPEALVCFLIIKWHAWPQWFYFTEENYCWYFVFHAPPPARGMKGSIRMSGGGSVLVQQLDTSLSVVEQRLSAASICFGWSSISHVDIFTRDQQLAQMCSLFSDCGSQSINKICLRRSHLKWFDAAEVTMVLCD